MLKHISQHDLLLLNMQKLTNFNPKLLSFSKCTVHYFPIPLCFILNAGHTPKKCWSGFQIPRRTLGCKVRQIPEGQTARQALAASVSRVWGCLSVFPVRLQWPAPGSASLSGCPQATYAGGWPLTALPKLGSKSLLGGALVGHLVLIGSITQMIILSIGELWTVI